MKNKKVPWNKGKKLPSLSQEHREKQSKAMKELWKKGHFEKLRKKLKKGFWKGHTHTKEAKEKMRLAHLGVTHEVSKEARKKISLAHKGKRYTNGQWEKSIARSLLNVAIARKKISKKPCEVCGNTKVQGHHPDYHKPLKVKWLCIKHHHELHKGKKYVSF